MRLGLEVHRRPRGVDQGHQREPPLGCQPHQLRRLAEALRPHPPAVAAALLGNHHHGEAGQLAHAADQRRVVAQRAVAVQLQPLGHQSPQVV